MDCGNRVLFAILGAVLLVAGLAVGLGGLGLVPAVDESTRLLPDALRDRWHDFGVAAWLVTAAVGVLLAVLGALLARAQLTSRRGRPMPDLLLTDPATIRREADARHHPDPGDRRRPDPGERHRPDSGERQRPDGGTPDDRESQGPPAGEGGPVATGPGRTRVRAAALVHGIERDLARHPKVRRVDVQLAGDAADPRMSARVELRADADVPQVQAYLSESLTRFTTTTGLTPADVQVVVTLTDRDQMRVH